jgi:endonuclease YncB( thermonuclease family)
MKFIKSLIVFWKTDIINKFIIIICLLLAAVSIAFLFMISNMPKGKSLFGAISEILPLPPTATATRYVTNTPIPTITSMVFDIPQFTQTIPTIIGNVPQTTTISTTIYQILPSLTPLNSTPTLAPGIPTSTSLPSATPEVPINNNCIPKNPPQNGTVVEVLDGNTVRVLIDTLVYPVRYTGIAAPNPRDKIKSELARLENIKLVYGNKVTLITDVSSKDDRGRLLRYVMVGNTFVNLKLLQQGLASALDVPPDSACAQSFKAAEQFAINSRLGIWNLSPTPITPTP